MSRAKFRVMGRLDSAGGAKEGTVVIDRSAGLFEVRPLRAHRTYTMPLSMVADMVVSRLVMNEYHDKRKAAKAASKK